MELSKHNIALQYLERSLEDLGLGVTPVCAAIEYLHKAGLAQVCLVNKVSVHPNPHWYVRIHGVDKRSEYFPKGLTNSVEHAKDRDAAAIKYFGVLGSKAGLRISTADAHGFFGYESGDVGGKDDYFVAESKLALPVWLPDVRNDEIGITVSVLNPIVAERVKRLDKDHSTLFR